MPRTEAINSCHDLGESLWTPQYDYLRTLDNSEYVIFQEIYTSEQKYWIGPVLGTPSTVTINGETQNTSSAWQVNVLSNNEQITG